MKHSLAIQFDRSGASLLPQQTTHDLDALAQQCCVLAATSVGSCKALPDMGTELQKQAVRSALRGRQALIHAANFAAVSILFFVRKYDGLVTGEERLDAVTLQVTEVTSPLKLRMQLITTTQRTTGKLADLPSPV
jgi:hypothetical protein